ncbi:MAG: rhamnogalacturonan lyase [Bacteroidales bacterium]|nr:rhamnogalacturonan lyase [Bacteroidales bacterium]
MKSIYLYHLVCFLLLATGIMSAQPAYDFQKLKQEDLGRGFVAVREDPQTVHLSWRYLISDPADIAFELYRNGEKVNYEPLKNATFFSDRNATDKELNYELHIINQQEQGSKKETQQKVEVNQPYGYINIPLNIPPDGVTPSGQHYSYHANDASVGDVDGDGEYEIILKWDPSNAHDNAHDGYTGNVYMDCYKLNGEQLWRIDLGRNIRAGAHYTQFIVFDLDGDNKAEVVIKTGDGTMDGTGVVIGDPDADHRNNKGRILSGPEYLTLFEGETGKALQTIDYIPARGSSESWGDDRANRSDRFLACVAYLDGEYPSVVMCRGYYTRTVLAAFDWRNGELTNRWVFDSDEPGNEKYAGQGNHNLRVGDVDSDGRDEIVYGSCTIDNDGKGLYSTEMGHGDAMHLTVFDPSSRKLQVWDCHENKRDGSSFRDAATGEVLFQVKSNSDVGRALAADIDPTSRGVEMWSLASGGIRNVYGEVINPSIRGISVNMACWWDGDLSRELLNGTEISKYNPGTGVVDQIFDCDECVRNNGTKSTPVLAADIIGDWREEVILRTSDNQNLRIYVSPHETNYRFHTFMQDPVYRISVATQNVAYNQPTQPGYYFGSDLEKVFYDNEIETSSNSITLQTAMPYDSYQWSNGKTAPTITIHREEALPGNSIRMELEVTYRGYRLKDFVTITFF